MIETWKDIKGYKGRYQVSNLGRIKRLECFGGDGRLLKAITKKPTLANNGYMMIWLGANNKKKAFLVHRLVAQAFIPNPSNLPQVNHKDQNRTNNRVDNLEWCTHMYNQMYGDRNKKIGLIHKGKKISQKQKEMISAKMKVLAKTRLRNSLGQFIEV